MNPLFRHNEKLMDLNQFLDENEDNQGLTEEGPDEGVDLYDSLGG